MHSEVNSESCIYIFLIKKQPPVFKKKKRKEKGEKKNTFMTDFLFFPFTEVA